MDQAADRTVAPRNVGDTERWASLAAGLAMAAYGLTRRRASGWALTALGVLLLKRGASGHCDVYDILGVDRADGGDTRRALGGRAGVHVNERTTIGRPAAELYRFWRNLENLPRFMRHLSAVEPLTETISRWRADGPAGTSVEWTAEIINEIPNRLLAWRSIEGSDVVSAGSVHFDERRPGETRLWVRLQYSPPAGKVGAAVAWLFGRDAATQIREDLQRFKQMAEDARV
jgi:uncharacterized membrane protein